VARDADADGFAEFVVARERALQRTAWLLTGDWALAEDLVQTALVRSWPTPGSPGAAASGAGSGQSPASLIARYRVTT
jgi:DNA-directed RNA polymerase specialized sigma24 family protein